MSMKLKILIIGATLALGSTAQASQWGQPQMPTYGGQNFGGQNQYSQQYGQPQQGGGSGLTDQQIKQVMDSVIQELKNLISLRMQATQNTQNQQSGSNQQNSWSNSSNQNQWGSNSQQNQQNPWDQSSGGSQQNQQGGGSQQNQQGGGSKQVQQGGKTDWNNVF